MAWSVTWGPKATLASAKGGRRAGRHTLPHAQIQACPGRRLDNSHTGLGGQRTQECVWGATAAGGLDRQGRRPCGPITPAHRMAAPSLSSRASQGLFPEACDHGGATGPSGGPSDQLPSPSPTERCICPMATGPLPPQVPSDKGLGLGPLQPCSARTPQSADACYQSIDRLSLTSWLCTTNAFLDWSH